MKLWIICIILGCAYNVHSACEGFPDDLSFKPEDGASSEALTAKNLEIIEAGRFLKYLEPVQENPEEDKWVIKLRDMEDCLRNTPSIGNLYRETIQYKITCENNDDPTSLSIPMQFLNNNLYHPSIVDGETSEDSDGQATRTLTLPFPFPVIDNFLVYIIEDIDLYNQNIVCDQNNDHFIVSCKKDDNDVLNKRFKMVLKPKITITKEFTTNISMEDAPTSFDPNNPVAPNKLILTINVKKDNENSIISFDKNTYSADLFIDLKEPRLDHKLSKPKVDAVNVAVEGDHKDSFVADILEQEVTIKYKPGASLLQDLTSLELTLIATTSEGDTASSTLFINVIHQQFEKTVYVNTYDPHDGPHELEDIVLINAGDQIIIEAEQLQCIKSFEDSKLILQCTLPTMTGNFLETKVTAKNGDNSHVSTTVIIHSTESDEKPTIKFTEIFYEGVIDDDLSITTNIQTIEDCTNLKFDVLPLNEFTASCKQPKTVELQKTGPITTDDNYLALSITATDKADEDIIGSVTVILEVKKDETPLMTFTESGYVGKVGIDRIIRFDDPQPELQYVTETPIITINKYDEYFDAKLENNYIVFTVKTFPEDFEVASLTLTATTSITTAESKVLLSIEQEDGDVPAIEFTEIFYKGVIEDDLTITTDIQTIEDCTNLKFDVLPLNEFTASCKQPKTVELQKTGPITTDENYLVLSITATDEGNGGITGSVTVLLDVKDHETPSMTFTESGYVGKVGIDKIIKFDGPEPELQDVTETPIITINKYDEYFHFNWETDHIDFTVKTFPEDLEVASLTLTAATSTTIAESKVLLTIEQVDGSVPTIKFTEIFYEGVIDDDLSITTDIQTIEDCTNLKFDVLPLNEFTASCKQPKTVELQKTGPITTEENYLVLSITATDELNDGITGFATVILEVKHEETPSMTFTEKVYEGIVGLDNLINFDGAKPELQDVSDDPRITIDKYQEFFEVTWDNEIVLSVTKFPEDLKVAPLIISAKTSTVTVSATVLLTIEQEDVPSVDPITFAKPLYSGQVRQANDDTWIVELLNNEPIKITSDSSDVQVVVDDSYQYKDIFKVIENAKDEEFSLVIEGIPNFGEDQMISFTLVATTSDGSEGHTAVSLEIVSDSQEEVIGITFQEYDVAHTQVSGSTWEDILMKADSTDPQDTVTYTIQCPLTINAVKINKDTGVVSIENNIDIGTHTCFVTATGSHSEVSAKTPLVFVVKIKNEPVPDKKSEFSHKIVHISEDLENGVEILKVNEAEAEYGFCLIKYEPDDGRLYIDKDDKTLNCKQLKREDPIFDNIDVPQYLVQLLTMKKNIIPEDGICPTTPDREKRDLTPGIVLTDIKMNPLQTVVTVLIDDVNNNDPEFKDFIPIVGYPNRHLLDSIQPRLLTQLHATDKDSLESLNGKITYESLSPDDIEVNPDTGEVYPTMALHYAEDPKVFEVRACDNGSPRRCSEKQTFEVKILDVAQIASLVVQTKIERLDDYLESVASDGVRVFALDVRGIYENVPSRRVNRFQRDGDEEIQRKTHAAIYALDAEGQPMAVSAIQELFVNEENVVVKTFVPNSVVPGSISDSSDDGLLIAVIILGVLLAAVLLGGVYLLYRKKKNSNISSNLIEASPISPDIFKSETGSTKVSPKLVKKAAPSPPATRDSTDDENETNNDKEKEYGKIEFVKNSRSSDVSLNKKLERRATGYPLNCILINNIPEVDDADSVKTALPPYKGFDDDLESVMTSDTVKSVSFNNNVVRSELYEDTNLSD